MRRILLTGVTGQVGRELQRTLPVLGKVIGVDRQELDLSKPEQIRRRILEIEPDIIVNAAAYTAVDQAETESEIAIAINARAPQAIAQAAQDVGATVLHISTDYVFNGKHHTPYLETDLTDPLGVYGKSKLLGEQGVASCDRHIILRTSWVYGSRGHGNFVKTMLKLGAARSELKVVADQIGSPTWSYDIALTITRLLSKSLTNPDIRGIYNFSSSGVASWYDLAVATFTEARQLGFPLKVERVLPITTAEFPTASDRPPYSVLSKTKISQTLGTYPPHWQESLSQMLREWREISLDEVKRSKPLTV